MLGDLPSEGPTRNVVAGPGFFEWFYPLPPARIPAKGYWITGSYGSIGRAGRSHNGRLAPARERDSLISILARPEERALEHVSVRYAGTVMVGSAATDCLSASRLASSAVVSIPGLAAFSAAISASWSVTRWFTTS